MMVFRLSQILCWYKPVQKVSEIQFAFDHLGVDKMSLAKMRANTKPMPRRLLGSRDEPAIPMVGRCSR